jgi:ubiquinone/menaquinone biosynthesis C-methylase UbiE
MKPSRRTLLRCLAAAPMVALVTPSGALFAQRAPDEPRYHTIAKTRDGIGKAYMGREIAGVMGWQAASWLEREEREREERGDLLLRELELRPGMVVADIGAGSGYYTRRIAPLLLGRAGNAPDGFVYAVDVQPEMIQILSAGAKKANLTNVKPVLCSVDNVNLPAASVDLALMVDVYHELEFPFEVMESVVRALKPGGKMVYVEYRLEDPNVPIKLVHKMSQAQVRKEAAAHALTYERTASTLPWQHVMVFRRN